MTPIVIDNSVFLAWCMGDEEEPTANSAMQQVIEQGGVTPRIWWYELRNALLVNERRDHQDHSLWNMRRPLNRHR